ncbi:class I SAM-dependent methyltransferase [Microbacterium terrisoli]|uniref:class I SAM-dependent methyltransferase n=1 Tax=Microbacterium terrisoli TaxID=3242192 RepID=UPI0028063A5B|nr:class I SAM-dependent methyltransferase [Microbacterium protaetiae]
MVDGNPIAAGWDRTYLGTPPWDIGRPQPAFLAAADELAGTVVEFGCGTGEQTLLAARRGARAIGLDISSRAIARAQAKAAAAGLAAQFEVADVLDAASLPADLEAVADLVIDSGTFHMFGAHDRHRYAASAERVLTPSGRCMLLTVRPDPARSWGPPGVTPAEAVASFGERWRIVDVTDTSFETTSPLGSIPASLIVLGPA